MQTLLFSVHDGAAERFLDPFVAPTVTVALRGFQAAIGKPGHPFNEFPSDYTLFQVGEFDPETGHLVPITPHSLGNGVQFSQDQGASPSLGMVAEGRPSSNSVEA